MKFIIWLIQFIGIIKEFINPAIELVELIKKAAKNPEQKFIEIIFEKYRDEAEQELVIEMVRRAIAKTMGENSKCLKFDSPVEVVDCFIAHLRTQKRHIRNAIYRELVKSISLELGATNSKFDNAAESTKNTLIEVAYEGYKRRNRKIDFQA